MKISEVKPQIIAFEAVAETNAERKMSEMLTALHTL